VELMASLPTIDTEYLRQQVTALCRIASPTGMTEQSLAHVEKELASLGLPTQRTGKGALLATLSGSVAGPARALAAHVDTLGAMVSYVKPNGRLQLTQLGGYSWNTVEGEYCTVHTFGGREYTGTILLMATSVHVHGDRGTKLERNAETMEVRIDARTDSDDETRALGIGVGDFVSLDPRACLAGEGFIKSRHLDDKAGVACLLAAARALGGRAPRVKTYLFISNFEETGHGAAGALPADTGELVAVDMAAIGEGYQTSDESSVTVCVKDSSGPYDHGLSSRLRHLAEKHGIPYKVDIYRHYGSDASAALRAGGQFRTALIGPGVDASHAFERTHERALAATTSLCLAYLLDSGD
jgi:putative aminopeptidase FrvX